MRKPDIGRFPAAFREEYRRHVFLRLLGCAAVFVLAGVLCALLDFSGLKYPAMGTAMIFAIAAAADCVLFRLHHFLRPSWEGTVTAAGSFSRIKPVGTRGQPGHRTMVEITVDRGEAKPYVLSLFRADKIADKGAAVNVFQTHAPYKVGDTLVYFRGLRYPARVDVKDVDALFAPEFVCPYCGEFSGPERSRCYRCGKTTPR